MRYKRYLPQTLEVAVRLVHQEGTGPDLIGYVLWFNGQESALIDEPDYPGGGDHHIYRLSDGTRRNKPRYPAYRIHEESLVTLREHRRLSREIVNVPAAYRRVRALVDAMSSYLPIRGDGWGGPGPEPLCEIGSFGVTTL